MMVKYNAQCTDNYKIREFNFKEDNGLRRGKIIGRKLRVLLLCACMLMNSLGLAPVMAAEAQESQIIEDFVPLSDEAAIQSTVVGTAQEDLNLPDTLSATVEGAAAEIAVTEWTAQPEYKLDTADKYIFTPVLEAGYTLAEGNTLPTVEITTTAESQADTEEQKASVTITVEPDEPLYLIEGQPVADADLLAGVTAADENGDSVEVTVQNVNGLDMENPQLNGVSGSSLPYLITYAAAHPDSGIAFTATREAYVTLGLRNIMPMASNANTIDLSDTDSDLSSAASSSGGKYTYNSAAKEIVINSGPVTITGSTTNRKIVATGKCSITLQNVTIQVSEDYACALKLNSGANVTLTLVGKNILVSGERRAGLEASIGTTITITAADTNQTLTATGSLAAGIGGGANSDSNGGNITISGGSIFAQGDSGGAGIGGTVGTATSDRDGGNIKITGGSVNAVGGTDGGAGIGGGGNGHGGNITISGGNVTASGSKGGAGIGGGRNGGGGGTVTISGGTVTATRTGSNAAREIGHGSYGPDGTITITGGSVNTPNNAVSPQPTNGTVPVYLNTLTVGKPDIGDRVSIDAIGYDKRFRYENNDVITTNGVLYIWLPQNADTAARVDVIPDSGLMYTNIWARTNTTEKQTLFIPTNPTGVITVKNNDFTSFLNSITFGLFFKDSVDVAITGEDTGSGVSSIEYIKTDKAMTEAELKDAASWTAYNNSFAVTANEKFIIYAKITNNLGNSTFISSNGIVVYKDSEANIDGGGFLKTSTDDLEVIITMNGNTVKSIMNGNNTLTEGDDYTVDSDKITFLNAYLKSLADGTKTFTIAWYPLGETETAHGNSDTPGTSEVAISVSKADQAPLSIIGLGSSYTYGDSAFNLSVSGGSASGEVAFTSSDLAVASVSGDTVTIHKAGSFTITAKKAGNDEYKEISVTSGFVTVSEAAPTVILEGDNVSYGNDVTLNVTITGAGALPMGTVTFKEGETVLATEPLVNGMAGCTVTKPPAGNHSYTAKYSGQSDYYTAATETKSIGVDRIDQAELSITGKPDTVTYGDDGFTLETSGGSSTGTVTFSVPNDDVIRITPAGEVTIRNAGTVTVTATKAGDNNYNAVTATLDITVLPRDIKGITVTVTGSTIYTGSQLQPTFTASDGTLAIDTGDYINTYGTNITVAEGGTITLTGQRNYVGIKTINFNILKAIPAAITFPAAEAVTYDPGQTLADIPLSGGLGDGTFAWQDDTIVPTTNNGGYMVVFTPNDTENYDYSGITLSDMAALTVNQAEQVLTGLMDLVKINGGKKFSVTPVSNAEAENPVIVFQSSDTSVIDIDENADMVIKGDGTATITVLAEETTNYQSTSSTFEIKVLADTASLKDVIQAAEELNGKLGSDDIGSGNGQYPQAAVEAFQDAIDKAKEIANDSEATQEEVDQVKEDLLKAIENLQNSLIQVDFSKLDAAITQAEGLNSSNYTPASWGKLEKALLAGKTIRETKRVTQAETDMAAEDIFSAIAALESAYKFTTCFDTFSGSDSVTATVNAPYDKFVSLTVGGAALDQNCCIVTEGSTVITLQEAYLKTLANGTYVVSAEFTDGIATTTLTVNVSEAKSVTGVTLDCSNVKITVGKTRKLIATVTPSDAVNQDLTWSSSDASIAVVDANGKVTGIKAGSAVITVTTKDGSYMATCKVTVTAAANTSDSSKSSGTQDMVKTGEYQNIWVWISLLGVSVLMILGIYLITKRKLSVRKRK